MHGTQIGDGGAVGLNACCDYNTRIGKGAVLANGSATHHDQVIPEEYVLRLTMSNLQGVDNLSPKLCVPVDLQGRQFTLTGILPKSEFQAKAAWAGAGIFSLPIGCGWPRSGLREPTCRTRT